MKAFRWVFGRSKEGLRWVGLMMGLATLGSWDMDVGMPLCKSERIEESFGNTEGIDGVGDKSR